MSAANGQKKGPAASSSGARRDPQLILVGWDGATPELLLRFAQAGKLPTTARLIEAGGFRPLRSTIPPVTACAWSSFLTGRNPGQHGLYDFVTPRAGSYSFDYVHGGYRQERGGDLLSLLNRAGLRVGCVNVPMTYPPKAVTGFMVSGLDAPDEHSGIAQPAELFARAQADAGPYRIDNRHLGSMSSDDDRQQALDEFKRIETRRTDVTLAMLRREPVDVLIIVYNATDQVQHHFWHLTDPTCRAYPGAESAEVERFHSAIEEVYAHCDAELARWIELFPNADVMLMSDHGAGPADGPRVRLNNALAEAGLLTWAEARGSPLRDAVAWFDGFLRRTLSAKQKAMLARLLPKGRAGIESLGLPPVDWSQTLAFAYEGFTLSPCVWINRRDRFPEGTVAPGEEYERACARVTGALRDLKDPETGAPVMPRVYRARDVYHGACQDAAPDLILAWWEGQTFTMTKSHPKHTGEPTVFYPTGPVVPGRDITGIHRRDGVLVASGPRFARVGAQQLSPAALEDIAPTALALLGLEVPADMDGRVLADTLAVGVGDVRKAERPALAPTDEGSPAAKRYSADHEEAIRRRLSSLGYLE